MVVAVAAIGTSCGGWRVMISAVQSLYTRQKIVISHETDSTFCLTGSDYRRTRDCADNEVEVEYARRWTRLRQLEVRDNARTTEQMNARVDCGYTKIKHSLGGMLRDCESAVFYTRRLCGCCS